MYIFFSVTTYFNVNLEEIDQEFIAEAKAKLDKWFEADLKNRTSSIVAKTKTISSKSEKKPEGTVSVSLLQRAYCFFVVR